MQCGATATVRVVDRVGVRDEDVARRCDVVGANGARLNALASRVDDEGGGGGGGRGEGDGVGGWRLAVEVRDVMVCGGVPRGDGGTWVAGGVDGALAP